VPRWFPRVKNFLLVAAALLLVVVFGPRMCRSRLLDRGSPAPAFSLPLLQENGRAELKIGIMSATLQAGAAQEYLGGCPHLHAEGRIHPVAISYIQRLARKTLWENAAAELDALLASGAAGDVLIFMPGAYEIWKTIDACGRVRSPERLCLLPLHGELPPQDQRQVMRPAAAGRTWRTTPRTRSP